MPTPAAPSLPAPHWPLALGLPLLVAVSSFLITQSAVFQEKTEILSNAIVADLTLIAPLAYYWAIRKRRVAKSTVISVAVAGLILAGWMLDAARSPVLQAANTFAYPLLELALLLLLARKIRQAARQFPPGTSLADFPERCRQAAVAVLGKGLPAAVLAGEVSTAYYAFRGRLRQVPPGFAVHRESGAVALLYMVAALLLIETAALHLLLERWSHTAAWVATGLSLYTVFQLFGHIRALAIRRIRIEGGALHLYNGLAAEARIPLEQVARLELSNAVPEGRKSVKMALLDGLETHQAVLYLKAPVQVYRLMGLRQEADVLLFAVDEAPRFAEALAAAMASEAAS